MCESSPSCADVLPSSYGAGETRPRTSSPGAPTIASGVAFALSVDAETAIGVLSRAKRRTLELNERRGDVRSERHGQLDLAGVDVEPAAAGVLANAGDLECGGARPGGDEVPAKRQAEHRSLPRREQRFARPPEMSERVHVAAARFGCTSKWRCGLPLASPESPFQAICWPAVTFAPFGTANVTPFTQPPLLSLRGVRSLLRWM